MEQRKFKGVWIPAELWLEEALSITEKCLLVEIDSLDIDPDRGCFASNEYLGNFLRLSSGRTANMISDLRKRGFIIQVYFDGRNRGLRVPMLHENVMNLHENVKPAFTKTLSQPSRKREHNNKESSKEDNNSVVQVVDLLNKHTNSTYKPTTDTTRKFITARLKEGYTLEDFEKVILTKARQWMGGEMEKYLRPATLFSPSHFEAYLNEARKPSPIPNQARQQDQPIRSSIRLKP